VDQHGADAATCIRATDRDGRRVLVEREEPHDDTTGDRDPGRPLVGDHGGEVLAGLVVGVGELDVGERLVEGAKVDLGDRGRRRGGQDAPLTAQYGHARL
jgi:hypothetical protein